MFDAALPAPHQRALIGSALIAVAVVAAVLRFGIYAKSSRIFGPSVYRGRGQRRSIALTFDDGPSPSTLALASYLFHQGVRATFFQCGANVIRHPKIGLKLLEMGHELGNHTFTHARLSPRLGWQLNLVSPRRIYEELARTQAAIEQDAGVRPTLFRAPYGMRWFGLAAALHRLGLTGVMWTVIAKDWEWNTDDVIAHVLRFTTPGGIICLHDGRDIRVDPDTSVTLDAIQVLVPTLKRMGYEFETVTEIMTL